MTRQSNHTNPGFSSSKVTNATDGGPTRVTSFNPNSQRPHFQIHYCMNLGVMFPITLTIGGYSQTIACDVNSIDIQTKFRAVYRKNS
jgi:hypothetical protein